MTARDWQTGDVAMVTDGYGDEHVAVMASDEAWQAALWVDEVVSARPLAVIDPEAPIPDEWVRVFVSACASAELDSGLTDQDVMATGLAAVIAAAATPREPKPHEPTGDRATVRDRDGELWTRDNGLGGYDKRTHWVALTTMRYRAWCDLDVPAGGVLWGGVE